jgi:hypothetical protein
MFKTMMGILLMVLRTLTRRRATAVSACYFHWETTVSISIPCAYVGTPITWEEKKAQRCDWPWFCRSPFWIILNKFGSRHFEVGCKGVYGELKANEIFHAVNLSDGTLVSEATVNLRENEDADAASTLPTEASAGGAPDGMVAVSAK